MASGFNRRLSALLLAAGMAAGPVAASEVTNIARTVLDFSDLAGWEIEDHAAAYEVFLTTCDALNSPDWRLDCADSSGNPDPRGFFERWFRPVLIEDGTPGLFTGYYEPELAGALVPDAKFRYPLYSQPPEALETRPWFSRRALIEGERLVGRGLELVWVDDPVALFFLQIQGSGRIRLTDGSLMRVGYGGTNGHPYRSIGAELIRRGVFEPQEVTADVLKDWLRGNPQDGRELMLHNPSYVFFRDVSELTSNEGPLGAMNRPVTPMRSIAVDPAYVPLGAPVWIETAGETQFNRLMVAQDTGSAIKGAQRSDIFFGTGDAAGRAAGKLRDRGRMVVLLPVRNADTMLSREAP